MGTYSGDYGTCVLSVFARSNFMCNLILHTYIIIIQARILYDFEGDTENGELVINEGEEVVVLNQVSSILFSAHSNGCTFTALAS